MLALRSGARLGSYELLKVIGSGGMGVVYEARHEALGRRVAIKVLHPIAADSPQAALAKARFLREGRAAALVRHDNVVDIFDFGMHEETPFLVMELVEGESLAERLHRERSLPLHDALALILPIVSAVGDLHAAGIIHRDLKPANILLGRGRSGGIEPKVADFGVSRADDDAPGLTESGAVVGSYPYMPPEQVCASKMTSESADQYALGAILYECVTGSRPFEGDSPYALTHAILHAPLAPASSRNPALPAGIDAVLARALHRERAERFACVEDFGAALLPFAEPGLAARWEAELVPPSAAGATTSKSGETIAPFTSSNVVAVAPARRSFRAIGAAVAAACAAAIVAVIASRAPARESHSQPEVTNATLVQTTSPRIEEQAPSAIAKAESEVAVVPSAAPSASPIAPSAVVPSPARPIVNSPKRAPRDQAHPATDSHRDPNGSLDNGAPLLDPR